MNLWYITMTMERSLLLYHMPTLQTKLFTEVSQTLCPALQHPMEEQEEGLQIRPQSGWSHCALPND